MPRMHTRTVPIKSVANAVSRVLYFVLISGALVVVALLQFYYNFEALSSIPIGKPMLNVLNSERNIAEARNLTAFMSFQTQN